MKSVHITNGRGEELAGLVFEPSAEGRYMVVICHGFRGGKENGGKLFRWAERLQGLGLGVAAFDFSGSGSSQGAYENITLSRQAEDLRAIIDYVHQEFHRPIILLGRSFGGSTVLAGGSADNRVAGYVLWSVPAFLEKTFAVMLGNLYADLAAGHTVTVHDEAGRYRLGPGLVRDFAVHDMARYTAQIGERPVLIINARDDELVAPENPVYLHEKLKNCTLYMIEEAGHRFLEKAWRREDLTIEWLQRNFALLPDEATDLNSWQIH